MRKLKSRFLKAQDYRRGVRKCTERALFYWVVLALQINNLGYLSQDGDDSFSSLSPDGQDDAIFSSLSPDGADEKCLSLSHNDILENLSADAGADDIDSFPQTVNTSSGTHQELLDTKGISCTSTASVPILPSRFKNVYGTKGAKKRWLQEQRLKLLYQSHEPPSCPCVFCNPLPHPVCGGMRRSSRVSKAPIKAREMAESKSVLAEHEHIAEQEKKLVRQALRASADKSRKRKVRASDAGPGTELKRKAAANKRARTEETFSREELAAMSAPDAPLLPAISRERVRELVKNAQQLLAAPHQVCSVCDRMYLHPKDITNYELDNLPGSFFSVLTPPDGTTLGCPALKPVLREQYNVSSFFPGDDRFQNVLLSPRAFPSTACKSSACKTSEVETDPPSTPDIPVCKRCMLSLKTKRKVPKPPKFSIANGFYIGTLPEHLQPASRVDIKVCTAAYLGGWVGPTNQRVCIGGPGYVKFYDKTSQYRLKGHTYCTRQNLNTVAMNLPLHPNDVPVKVLLSGPFSPAQMKNASEK